MPRDPQSEFQEIAHSGGKVTFHIETEPDGPKCSFRWEGTRDGPAGIIAVYALPQGIPIAVIRMAGIGQPWSKPPIAGCYPVIIGSDSEGRFGRQCPVCGEYWRAEGWTTVCAYCGYRDAPHRFLTQAQLQYVKEYCERLSAALEADGDHVVDLDIVADAVGKEIGKPPFYYVEESQQSQFSCEACGGFNDILGRFGYCSTCGLRNDLQEIRKKMQALRERVNSDGPFEDCVRDAVAAFDSMAGRYAEELTRRIPMTPRRKASFGKGRFHSLRKVAGSFKAAADIDIFSELDSDEVEFGCRMFFRRHVYEHRGGEADEKYLADSGDTSVRVKQALRETDESAHRLIGLVLKMAGNLHGGFQAIFPPEGTAPPSFSVNK